MERIASFSIDHDKLEKGVYVSRVDGDVISYDIRMKKPNAGDYVPVPAAHTLEHLLATFIRNSKYMQQVVYVGPMGCRTGFYLLLRDTVSRPEVLALLRQAFSFSVEFEGEIPGAKRIECGNYLEHDLTAARVIARDMLELLTGWTADKMDYES